MINAFLFVSVTTLPPSPPLNVIRSEFSFDLLVWVLDEKSIIHFSTQVSVLSTLYSIMNVLSRI